MPRIETEAFPELGLPLVDERRRSDDERAPVTASFENLGDDERRLDRLAEADLVGDEERAPPFHA